MKINSNIQALNAYRNLNQNQSQVSKNLEKLSSGLRINRASDDAAGLAISEKMRSQIRGLKQSERNSMDGISLMQTSEGAMQEMHSMLQRMRELSVQAANDSNTEYDRGQIQKEIDELTKEIDSISEKTEFNTKKLLDGSSAVYASMGEADNGAGLASSPMPEDTDIKGGSYELEIDSADVNISVSDSGTNMDDPANFELTDSDMPLGDYKVEVEDYDSANESAKVTVFDPDGAKLESKTVNTGGASNVGGMKVPAGSIEGNGSVEVTAEASGKVTLFLDGEEVETISDFDTKNGKVSIGGLEIPFDSDIDNGTTNFEVTNNALAFQIGPNSDQQVMVDIPELDSEELGIADVDVTTSEGAAAALEKFDNAINQVSDARAKLGAVQNRFEHTVNNLQVTHENLSSSESRIRDADMAQEMTEFTRNNIINQSATAMLAQANQMPQGVLQLLQ
ncbi:flagellin N-terminal helical domain-containing protein [Salibacterium aidingense]|uniref:flagellin N-terminal helical domain-containing protein n=1 Tax=Salibacterium aidingense TaxID=384933 RepID=UPI000411DE64|nr:flagellin [Salibacterium aidingense]